MKRIVIDQPCEKNGVHFFGIELGHIVVAAIFTKLRHRAFGELPGVGFRHDVGGESTGRVCDVDYASLECVADFERRHCLWPTDIIDLNEPFAICIHPFDEFFKATRVSRFLGKRRDGAKGDFLGETRRAKKSCCE